MEPNVVFCNQGLLMISHGYSETLIGSDFDEEIDPEEDKKNEFFYRPVLPARKDRKKKKNSLFGIIRNRKFSISLSLYLSPVSNRKWSLIFYLSISPPIF